MIWRPDPPLRFLKVATACRRCGAPLAGVRTFTLCTACDDPSAAPNEPSDDPQVVTNRLARRRFDHYAAVLAAAEAGGWTLYRSQRSARSLSLYLEYWRPEAGDDPAAYRKVRVSDHDRRPRSGRPGGGPGDGAGFAEDWADLSAEFLFDPTLPAAAAAEVLGEAKAEAAASFRWP